jgi:Uma2 family endonuclease
MNEIQRPAYSPHATTQAADGLPRLAWTLAEFERLSELGFFGGIDGNRERLELIDGELLPMNAKGARHEWVRAELFLHLVRKLDTAYAIYSEPGWRPGGDLYLEPDMVLCRAGLHPVTIAPADVLLLIEVSDTSLEYDAGLKARVYANLGVREYWVVNAKTLETIIHLEPRDNGYATVVTLGEAEDLAPRALPELVVSLRSLKLG